MGPCDRSGADRGRLILIDEVLTPDSSRFWPADRYEPGQGQPSFDKQFVRDWLETTGWDKKSPPPALPDDVVTKTREKYIEAYEILTGSLFPWSIATGRPIQNLEPWIPLFRPLPWNCGLGRMERRVLHWARRKADDERFDRQVVDPCFAKPVSSDGHRHGSRFGAAR